MSVQNSLFLDNKDINKDTLEELIKLPKIDLHRHLLGSVRPDVVLKIAQIYSLPLQVRDKDELNQILIIQNPVNSLQKFFRPWRLISRLIISPEVVFTLAYEALKDAAKDNICYVELRVSWGATGKEKFPVSEFLANLTKAIILAEKEFNIIGRVVFGITRHIMGRHQNWMRKKLYNQILKSALDFKDICVVGFDLSGIENNYPPSMFKDFFREVKNKGFKITIHCGETTTKTNDIWEAINDLSADRIGHGISAIYDENLLNYLCQKKIPLEICPTSNILTSSVSSIKNHPIRKFKNRGIKIIVNTDNPVICNVSLSKEYNNLIKELNFNFNDIKNIIKNSAEETFAPPDLKNKIKTCIQTCFERR